MFSDENLSVSPSILMTVIKLLKKFTQFTLHLGLIDIKFMA